jgi:hypothetical protein
LTVEAGFLLKYQYCANVLEAAKRRTVMPIAVRRRNHLRAQILTLIVLSVLAGLVGGALVGMATGHPAATQAHAPTT